MHVARVVIADEKPCIHVRRERFSFSRYDPTFSTEMWYELNRTSRPGRFVRQKGADWLSAIIRRPAKSAHQVSIVMPCQRRYRHHTAHCSATARASFATSRDAPVVPDVRTSECTSGDGLGRNMSGRAL